LCDDTFGVLLLSAAARHCTVHLQLQSPAAAAAVAAWLALHLLHTLRLHMSGTSMAQQQDM
jgi:hypothetical protein